MFLELLQYKFRNFQEIKEQKMKAAQHDLETVRYGTPQPWSLVLSDIESLSNVNLLKSEVKLNIGA